MSNYVTHRLDGLEPDNLLAFMALVGLLRVLETARSEWRPRVSWTVDEPPLRPRLRVRAGVDENAVLEATVEGLGKLSQGHEFGALTDLTLPADEASRRRLQNAAGADRYTADLWAALISDAAITRNGEKIEPTPLCLMFGQGHQHFLSRLAEVPRETTPPKRGKGRRKIAISETQCLREALFVVWERPDATSSFRWDPDEDVRYALRATDPTDAKTKATTQHGANRLAAIGLSVFTVVPRRGRHQIRLGLVGGHHETQGKVSVEWPIWREPISLAAIRALLVHPQLHRKSMRDALGIAERRRSRRMSVGRFMNITRAEAIREES